jgi:hypothetical protein
MDSLRPARAELMLAGMHPSKRVYPPVALRSYETSTFGMISCFSRLRSSSVFEHARRAGSKQRQRPRRTTASRGRSADIRAWAKDQGVALSGRGRIPASIVQQYEAVTGGR